MKILKESNESYQVFELEYVSPTNKRGARINNSDKLEAAFDFAEDYIRKNGHEDNLRKNGNVLIDNGKFLEIKPVGGKALTYEFYGPRSGKVTGSYSDIRDLNGLTKMKEKYLKNEELEEASVAHYKHNRDGLSEEERIDSLVDSMYSEILLEASGLVHMHGASRDVASKVANRLMDKLVNIEKDIKEYLPNK